MKLLVRQFKGEQINGRGEPFITLIRSVVGQQISVKATASIWARFAVLCPEITPTNVLKLSAQELRSVGLSVRKGEYIQAVAEFFKKRRVNAAYWDQRSDDEVIDELSSIRGVVVGVPRCF